MSRVSICGHRETSQRFLSHRWSQVGDWQPCQGQAGSRAGWQGHSPAKHTRNELPSKTHTPTYKSCPSVACRWKTSREILQFEFGAHSFRLQVRLQIVSPCSALNHWQSSLLCWRRILKSVQVQCTVPAPEIPPAPSQMVLWAFISPTLQTKQRLHRAERAKRHPGFLAPTAVTEKLWRHLLTKTICAGIYFVTAFSTLHCFFF